MVGACARGSQEVDLRQHRVPVDEHVEDDERRDEDEREEIEQGAPLAPQRAGDEARQCGHVLSDRRRAAVEARLEIRIVGAELLARPCLEERPQARDLVGEGDGELLRLSEHQRHEEDEGDDDDAGEGGDDERCSDAARHAPMRQPVGGRVHEVGDDDAGDERQDDAAQ